MARQTGLIKIKGTLDNVNFYKSKDGHLARMKTSVDGTRIANDPAYERTRENNQEFGNAAQASKLLRDTLRPIALNASDGRITSRMTKIMSQIKNLDDHSARGQRIVARGITNPDAVALLRGVEFNKQSLLSSVLFKPYEIDTDSGKITLTGLNPMLDVIIPQGATDLEFMNAVAAINYESGETEMFTCEPVTVPINSDISNIVLTPSAMPTISGVKLYLLRISFYQTVNGVKYPLKNGAFNALKVVEAI